MAEYFGWKPDYRGIEYCLRTSEHPFFSVAWAAADTADYIERDTLLYKYLLKYRPNYRRGEQAIGSCVGWGAEIACTLLLAKEAYRSGDSEVFEAEAATEPLYAGSRVEARGYPGDGARAYGGFVDGSYGSAAAKFARDWGVLLRKDYSGITGQNDDDLRVYSGIKEKDWGAYGCGGQDDQERMDDLAKKHPIKEYSQVRSFDDAAHSISGLQCPVTIASSQGFGNMVLDSDGFARPSGVWYHQMALIGVRFGRRPGCLCAQSWGPNSTRRIENRWPRDMPENIGGFTFWIDADVLDSMFRQDDSWAFIGSGYKTDDLDFGLFDS